MNSTVILSILTMLGLGVGFAFLLSFAYRYFKIEEDPQIKKIEELLPGLNCGTCGFGSCHAYAENVVKEEDLSNTCPVAGEEVADKIANIIGIEIKPITSLKAVVHCGGTIGNVKHLVEYSGVENCQAAQLIKGGFLACDYGCLGLGDCAKVCPVDGIEIVNGLARVDVKKCISCGKCVEVCPRDIISLEEIHNDELVKVVCSSNESGKEVKQVCKVGCIGCKLCEKKGPDGVFKVKNNLSQVDYKKAKQFTDWREVIEACPTNCISLDKVKKKHTVEQS